MGSLAIAELSSLLLAASRAPYATRITGTIDEPNTVQAMTALLDESRRKYLE